MLWQHVVLCKPYGAESAPDYGCASCVMLCYVTLRYVSKEQCSSLKMISGSKHVGAILNVKKFYAYSLVGVLIKCVIVVLL